MAGAGRTSSRDAGATPESFGSADMCSQKSFGPGFVANATGRPAAGANKAEDMKTSKNFREIEADL
jgi:hypothetical protein